MVTVEDRGFEFRAARPEDAAALRALDSSFTTDTVMQVTLTDDGFMFREVTVDPPLTKVFPDEEDES